MSEQISCTIVILDKEYRVSCGENEKDGLIASARYLDEKMKALKDNIGVVGADRLAVIAALNIAHAVFLMDLLRNSQTMVQVFFIDGEADTGRSVHAIVALHDHVDEDVCLADGLEHVRGNSGSVRNAM